MNYTKIFAIVGAGLCLLVVFDNKPASPFHDASFSLRIIGGAILGVVGGAIGGLIGMIIGALTDKNPRSRISKKKCPYCAEEILFEAIKCKHCGEMFDKAIPLSNKQTATTRLVTVKSGDVPTKIASKENVNNRGHRRNIVLAVLALLILFPLAYSAVFGTSFGAMLVLLPIEGVVAWLTWLVLSKLLRCTSVLVLSLLSTGLGLAAGWYAAFLMCSAAFLQEVWRTYEKTVGRPITDEEAGALHADVLASSDYWTVINQKASIPAIGVFLMILLAIVIMKPKSETSRT